MAEISGSFRAFPEARDYFQRKLNLPTWRWDELWQAQHAKACELYPGLRARILQYHRHVAFDRRLRTGGFPARF